VLCHFHCFNSTVFQLSVCCAEIVAPSGPSRVSKLVARYSALDKSPLDDVTTHTTGSRGQSPVQEVVGDSEETEHEE